MSEENKEEIANCLDNDDLAALPPPVLPFELDDLCKLSFTFDTLK